ncbi:MAG: methionine--tRNA ligase [Lentisphaeraceae bacterium]|nr:methionine--tRNA ligase [Lentisphaeraceae bacterium]
MEKKRLITSALPYVNNEPHLGNIIGCVLSADAYARFCRSKGYETLYICGTDEYGTATETKAQQEGVTPREICDKYHVIHKEIYDHFNISFDTFGRTSTPEHTEIVQWAFKGVEDNDYLKEVHSEQYFCKPCDKFLADRLVKGACPKCKFEDAKGDQCDGCGAMLEPTELVDPKCSVCNNFPELRKTHHLHLDLPKIKGQLGEFQEKSIEEGFWPNNAKTTTRSWMTSRDLQSRAITRDLKWGVPVPKEGFDDKVFYVWFDAPLGYVSITRKAFPDTWKDWWLSPENTELYQFMAKDNIPFHSIIFPATQLATGENWTKVHHLSSTEYLNYEDTKFSKSNHIGVFGSDVIESGIHSDLWRFYLLAVRPERQDTAFSWEEFFTHTNNIFLNNIGNLVNRTLVYCQKNFDGKLEEPIFEESHIEFMQEVQELQAEITDAMDKVSIKEALRLILQVGSLGNIFFDRQKPWVKIKEDRESVATTISILIHLIRDIGVMIEPFMPETSVRILKMLNLEDQKWDVIGDFTTMEDHQLGQPEILYKKIDDKLIEKFKEQFSGGPKEDPWAKVELRVGKIVEIVPHPNAAHLYLEKIDLGEDEPRTIVSGLVKFFEAEELLNKHVLVATNLTPAELSGTLSDGMVLGVSKKKKMELVDCGDIAPGTLVYRKGDSAEARTEKIGLTEFKEAALRAVKGQVCIDGAPLMAGDTELSMSEILNGKLG